MILDSISRRRLILMLGSAALAGAGSGRLAGAAPAPGTPPAPTALDESRLDEAADRARGLDQLRALAVAYRGETVLAEAFRGPPVSQPVNVKSVSKSVVAALVGAAIDRGLIENVDVPLSAVAPQLLPSDAADGVGDITLANLLSMRAGLERTSGANYGRWVESRNWVRFALTRPFVEEPGTRMLYSTGNFHLLGAVLAEVTGDSLLGLAREWLGGPLGIEIPPWTRDPQGRYLGGNEMALSPLAMLRFGEMHRQGGLWQAERVLSADWIKAAWTPRTRSPFSGDRYGYGWFLDRAGGHDIAYARGYGGQMIYVVPSLALTVAITSDPTRPARSRGYAGDLKNLLVRDIVPAIAPA